MSYIQGFVLAVPAANKEIYRQHATLAGPLFRKFGATRLIENWPDDVPHGNQTDLYRATKIEDGEVPLFSWVEFADRAAYQDANRRMMEDPAMQDMPAMPFDGKRMIYGGFEALVDTGANGKPGYVDAMVSPVPIANKDAYRAAAEQQSKLPLEHGALRVVDAWGDDVPPGTHTDFQRAVDARDGENIGFSFIEWPSKQVRDAAWNVLMQDPRMAPAPEIWDARRSITGGFVPLLDI